MLTISLIMVINQQGYKKVAQYCRFDGYPYGVGVGVLNFIKNKELFEKLKGCKKYSNGKANERTVDKRTST